MTISKQHLIGLFIAKVALTIFSIHFIMDETVVSVVQNGLEGTHHFIQAKTNQLVSSFETEFMLYKGVSW